MIKIFKIKSPEIYSKELKEMYDFLFNELNCGWAGRYGHYLYDENEEKVAKNQDGYIYCWEHAKHDYKISALPDAYRYKYPISTTQIPELIIPSLT